MRKKILVIVSGLSDKNEIKRKVTLSLERNREFEKLKKMKKQFQDDQSLDDTLKIVNQYVDLA